MKIIKKISDFRKLENLRAGCVLTIGNFDGIHIGHQQILTTGRKAADEKKTSFVMLTFEPHPLAVLYPEHSPGLLTPPALKKHLLEESGVDIRLALESSREFLQLPAEDFLERFLAGQLRPAVVVEGDDFNFGAGRAGNITMLRQFAEKKGFEVVVVDSQDITLASGEIIRVSSTMLRYMLQQGHAADAALALGRPYRLIGKIIPGRGTGKRLGFPTLNMAKSVQLIPAEGVYAGVVNLADTESKVCTDNQKIPAAFSIGRTSTYGAGRDLLLEAHLLTENADRISGKYMAMDFVKRVRSQEKFQSEKELAEQIANDCKKAKEILATEE